MKKFKFSLEVVLGYKEQELEERKREHGLILAAIVEKEREIRRLERECADVIVEFNEKKIEGMTVIDAQSYEIHIRILHKNIEAEHEKLRELQQQAEEKQAEVVLAKQEVSSLEKLKEKKVAEYNKAAAKEEESFIEELITNKRAAAAG